MPTFTMTKSYADGNVLTEDQLDDIKNSTETFINTTKLDDDNLQNVGISKGKLTAVAQEFFVPSGGMIPYGGSSLPSGWLFCDGSAVSRTTFAVLFAAISTAYGIGDGSTTFNVPDKRGRVSVGKDDMDNTDGTGGGDAARMTTGGNRIDGDTLGANGGLESHTLVTAELSVHSHGITDGGHTHGVGTLVNGTNTTNHDHHIAIGGSGTTALSASNTLINDGNSVGEEYRLAGAAGAADIGETGINRTNHIHTITGSSASATTGVTTNNVGSGTAHDNVQPGEIDNWIIKT